MINISVFRAAIAIGLSFVLVSPILNAAMPNTAQGLLERFNDSAHEQLPVIIQFNDLLMQRSKKTKFGVDKRDFSTVLSDKQSAVLERIRPSSNQTSLKRAGAIKRFSNTPQMALSLSKSELELLLSDSTLSIWEDKLKRPSLAQSVQRVYPSQGASTFHGNNEWAVAVLDTGVDRSHSFLSNKVVSEACYSNGGNLSFTSSLCPGGATSSTASGSGSPCTINGCEHGTQVAGVAAGNGGSFDGVAKDANLISIQVYSQVNDEAFCFPDASCLGAFTSDIIKGLEQVYALRSSFQIAAANVSLGSDEVFSGTCDDQPEKAIIDLLKQANIAVVASSGNTGETSMMQAPACISSAIAVAATFDTSDTPWINNNISNALDLFAPGVNITSSIPGGGFASGTGTSLAAPHVAGAWAVIRHASPNLSVNSVTN